MISCSASAQLFYTENQRTSFRNPKLLANANLSNSTTRADFSNQRTVINSGIHIKVLIPVGLSTAVGIDVDDAVRAQNSSLIRLR